MKILCVGAGGSGMAAIVRWHLALNDEVLVTDDVVGSDVLVSQYPGATAWDMDKAGKMDRIIFSDAIPAGHQLRTYAQENGFRETSFPEELGALCVGRRVIAIAGTHGKSTTTALLSWAFTSANKDPLCFIGAEIPTWQGNFRWGSGPVVVEADEYKKHFLALHPETVIVTSLEMDHFDTYADEKVLLETFVGFCSQPSVQNIFIARGKPMLEDLAKALAVTKIKIVRFGERGDLVSIDDARYDHGNCAVSLLIDQAEIAITYPAVTCPHLSNLAAVIAVLAAEKISVPEMQKGIATFPGIRRRMERIGSLDNVPIYSDYAHHPTAVAETLAIVKKIWPSVRIAVLFEPHERLRTSQLRDQYAASFADANTVGLLPVYDPVGRERRDLVGEASQIPTGGKIAAIANYEEGFAWMKQFAVAAPSERILIIMGAGPIDGRIRKLLAVAE